MINFKNVTENLVYIISTNVLTAFIVYNVSVKANLQAINAFTPTIDDAIAKHTTAITNAIEIKDNKFKKNDSLNIIIDQKPTNNQKTDNISVKKVGISEKDTVKTKKKKRFLGLF